MFEITDKMVDDFYGSYERKNRFNDNIIYSDFTEDPWEAEDFFGEDDGEW